MSRRPWRLVDTPAGPVRVESTGHRWRVRMLVDGERMTELVDELEDVAELLHLPIGGWALDLEREPADPRFAIDPLIDAAGGLTELARRVGATRSSIAHAMARGARPWTADRWACALGFHPCEVWGDDWWAGVIPASRAA